MKQFKHGFVALMAVLGVSSTLLYTSCEKDSCVNLSCQNGGTCADNFCRCKTGYEGAECEIKLTSRFIGKWSGLYRCSIESATDSLAPTMRDTLTIFQVAEPDRVGLVFRRMKTDTLYGTAISNEILINNRNTSAGENSYKLTYNGNALNYVNIRTRDANVPRSQTMCNYTAYKVDSTMKGF